MTREVVREVPARPQPVNCPYCGHAYVPAETNYACPNCGAATPQDLLPQGTGSGDASQNAPEN